MTDNKEFYELLNSLAEQQSFEATLSDNSVAVFKQLKTSQLKELIKTVVDSPLTQAIFSSTVNKILIANLISTSKSQLNVVDRLMFVLSARKDTLSPKLTVEKEKETVHVDINHLLEKLKDSLKTEQKLFKDSVSKEGDVEIAFGIPTLESENKLVDEIYSKMSLDVNNTDELRKILGEAFINEIAKSIKSIKIKDETLNFDTVTFRSRVKTVESLPANLIKNVIDYIENYKQIIDKCLTVEDTLIPIDGSLFSSR